MFRKSMFLVISLLSISCATAGKINQVSLGMDKSAVLDKLGDPVSSAAKEGTEVLVYRFYQTDGDAWAARETEYWVYIKEGKVSKYGRAQDFYDGSHEHITLDHNISNK